MGDQKRVMTPKQAFENGSDWLVIGRPITKGNIKKNIDYLINHLEKWYKIAKFVALRIHKHWVI